MIKLFLLHPNFTDTAVDNSGQLYFCPDCALIEGFLSYYPEVRAQLEIIYVQFSKPRQVIVDLIGEQNQGCPVLVMEKKDNSDNADHFKSAHPYLFMNTPAAIIQYLAKKFQVGLPHP
ncbi:MAG TPA: DUF3088 domain-containing protein [Cytophagales bacterium]|nr:DUF3088 domain-containing protein [Cytophagales bacterium]